MSTAFGLCAAVGLVLLIFGLTSDGGLRVALLFAGGALVGVAAVLLVHGGKHR